ncbi:hypothetical protein [Sphingomonas montana]|uniref:hypothetical protein n=1 Tax=Sphingomonas montana TaxID=1843236 RepID=UPI00096E0978|nr:hypothetical protein [Sphingomonas montana]
MTLLMTAMLGLAAAPALSAAPAAAAKTGADVTRAQMQAEVDGVFKLADTNKDGFMSRAEFGKRMGVVLNRTPPGTKNAPTAKEAQDMLNAANAAFKAVDSNSDGKLSPAEASRRPMRAFDMVDANHDGVLTLAEKIAARKPGAGAILDRKLTPGR